MKRNGGHDASRSQKAEKGGRGQLRAGQLPGANERRRGSGEETDKKPNPWIVVDLGVGPSLGGEPGVVRGRPGQGCETRPSGRRDWKLFKFGRAIGVEMAGCGVQQQQQQQRGVPMTEMRDARRATGLGREMPR